MKYATLIAGLILMVGCGNKKTTMNNHNLPDGWTVGSTVSGEEIYSDPPESIAPTLIQFYGLREDDSGYRLYSIPAETPIADIVNFFEVGSHGAMSYGYDSDATIKLVADKATMISELFRCRVIFADPAGLKLKFLSPIEDADLDKFTELFPEQEAFQSGAEGYIIEQEPGRHLFQRVKDENMFHFWWD